MLWCHGELLVSQQNRCSTYLVLQGGQPKDTHAFPGEVPGRLFALSRSRVVYGRVTLHLSYHLAGGSVSQDATNPGVTNGRAGTVESEMLKTEEFSHIQSS